MRDYARVEPKMWHGSTMKALRKRGPEAVVVALYLMTSPSSNMLGLFSQPLLYVAHETGLGLEGASKGLQWCIEEGFCSFDDASEVVWVHEMARYQIAPELKAADLRCKGIQKEYDSLPENPFLTAFYERYGAAFHMAARRVQGEGASKALCKPLRSQEQEQEQEQEKEKPSASSAKPTRTPCVPCPIDRIVELYHEALPDLPRVKLMTPDREKAIRKRWAWVLSSRKSDNTPRATNADEALDWFRDYFVRATDNDFLMGRGARSAEHANWRCDLDFLLTDRGMKHVIEKTQGAA